MHCLCFFKWLLFCASVIELCVLVDGITGLYHHTLTSAESKATYEEIREYVLKHTGLKVSPLYIAQVKQKYGIIERENYNKPKSENAKRPQCPPEKEKAIEDALMHFQMLTDI